MCHFKSHCEQFLVSQTSKTNVQRKLLELVLGFSSANQKQRNIKSRVDRLNQKIRNLMRLINYSKIKTKLKNHVHIIREYLKGIKKNVNQLTKSKVRFLFRYA